MDGYPDIWCLTSIDGVDCKQAFSSYDDFEEHFLQEHLNLTIFGCAGEGCTAQFATALQIFRHLAICKRKGKKVQILDSENILESLALLDRAKLLAMHCCVHRAIHEREMNENGTVEQDETSTGETDIQSSITDDQLHVPITESPDNHPAEEMEREPKYHPTRERAVTPARLTAWRMKEQMLLEEQMKKNKNPEPQKKVNGGRRKKQKKLPVKITHRTRFSALITDDPENSKASQITEFDMFRDVTSDNAPSTSITKKLPAHATESRILDRDFPKQTLENAQAATEVVNSKSLFTSAMRMVSTGNKPTTALERTHNPAMVTNIRPKVFESSLPAGPNLPPKIPVSAQRQRSSSLGPSYNRPPDYSEFARNPVINPTIQEIPHLSSQLSFVDDESSVNTQERIRSSNISATTNVASGDENRDYVPPRGILRRKATDIAEATVTNQSDFNLLTMFSKKAKECKVESRLCNYSDKSQQHRELNEQLTDTVEPTTSAKHIKQTESVKSDVEQEKKVFPSVIMMSEDSESNRNRSNSLSDEEDHGTNMDDEDDEAAPNFLNLFLSNESNAPELYDPRIKPVEEPSTSKESARYRRITSDDGEGSLEDEYERIEKFRGSYRHDDSARGGRERSHHRHSSDSHRHHHHRSRSRRSRSRTLQRNRSHSRS